MTLSRISAWLTPARDHTAAAGVADVAFDMAPNLAPEEAPEVATTLQAWRRLQGATHLQHPTPWYEVYRAQHRRPARGAQRPTSPAVRRIWTGPDNAPLDPPCAHEHAMLLLHYLQSHAYLAGHDIPASDLEQLYGNFCLNLRLDRRPWQTVATSLRLLTGGVRRYRRINGRNVRVYRVMAPSPACQCAHL